MLDKPALTTWKINQAVSKALGEDYVDPAEKAAEGTRIHDAIEEYFLIGEYNADYEPHVRATLTALEQTYPDVDDWVAEKSFATGKGGYGGKVDLHSPKHGIVVDFKTKDMGIEDLSKLKLYDEHKMQIAAYYCGLGLPYGDVAMKGANIFISRDNPGVVRLMEHDPEELRYAYKMFETVLELWYYIKRVDRA